MSTEAIMWKVGSDPLLRSDFGAVALLEAPPDYDLLQEDLRTGVKAVPRLRRRPVSPPLEVGPLRWIDDDFDPSRHIRRLTLPERSSLRTVLDVAAFLWSAPLDPSRPPWEFTIFEGLHDGRAALVQRIHHAVADGIGWARMCRLLLDPEACENGQTDVAAGSSPHSPTGLGELLGTVRARATQLGARFVGDPMAVIDDALKMGQSLQRQALLLEGARSPAMLRRCATHHWEVHSLPLQAFREVVRDVGGSLNDVLVTGVGGALAAYHERRGATCDRLRMSMPIRLAGTQRNNQFVPVRVEVPLTPKDPLARLKRVKKALARARAEPALALAEPLAAAISMLPGSALRPIMKSQTRTVDFAAAVVPGIYREQRVAGVRIEDCYPIGPRMGCALNITLLPWRNRLELGLNIDPVAVGSPEVLMECLTHSFDDLLTTRARGNEAAVPEAAQQRPAGEASPTGSHHPGGPRGRIAAGNTGSPVHGPTT